MLKDYQINLFIRVVKRRMRNEDLDAEEVLASYPALTQEDKDAILAQIHS